MSDTGRFLPIDHLLLNGDFQYIVAVHEFSLNGNSGSFPAVQPISNTYTFSLWLAPGYEGQLSAKLGPSLPIKIGPR